MGWESNNLEVLWALQTCVYIMWFFCGTKVLATSFSNDSLHEDANDQRVWLFTVFVTVWQNILTVKMLSKCEKNIITLQLVCSNVKHKSQQARYWPLKGEVQKSFQLHIFYGFLCWKRQKQYCTYFWGRCINNQFRVRLVLVHSSLW